jgi:hypothetical protein
MIENAAHGTRKTNKLGLVPVCMPTSAQKNDAKIIPMKKQKTRANLYAKKRAISVKIHMRTSEHV